MNTNLIDPIALKNANAWLEGNYDNETKDAIRKMIAESPEEVTESFYRNLEFGTGGLRGIMGVGTNRMNKYVVAMATQGFANYAIKSFAGIKPLKAAVAHDSRNNSRVFAKIVAEVFAANGFEVYLFEDMRPTPELSFAIRHFGCQTGVNITASHNPKEYNGYKAYWNDGGQLVAPHDENVIDEVLAIKDISDVKMTGGEDRIKIIGKEVDEIYIGKIKELSLNPECIKKHHNLKIVYTPLHGTGAKMVPQTMKEVGFTNVISVPEQSIPDGNFPTTKSPNPEEKAALEMAIALAKKENADVVLATDPDADRVGVAIRTHKNDWMLLNGNQTAAILTYYLISQWKANAKLKGNEYIIKTVVTTELIKDIAGKYNVECFDVLTGFKFIADKIREEEGKKVFIGGGEESYGFMIGDFVRDKDAVSTCCVVGEIAAWAAEQGKNLNDILIDIYREYGFYKEGLISVTRKGKSGAEEIDEMMRQYRSNPPKTITGFNIVKIIDYKTHESKDLLTGKIERINLPESNVLQFFTENGSKITVRPSGTEPKIKYYFSVKAELKSKEDFEKVNALLDEKIIAIQKDMKLI